MNIARHWRFLGIGIVACCAAAGIIDDADMGTNYVVGSRELAHRPILRLAMVPDDSDETPSPVATEGATPHPTEPSQSSPPPTVAVSPTAGAGAGVTLHLPLLSSSTGSTAPGPWQLDLVRRLPDLSPYCGLGVPETRNPCMDTLLGGLWLLDRSGQSGASTELVSVRPAGEQAQRQALPFTAHGLRTQAPLVFLVGPSGDEHLAATFLHAFLALTNGRSTALGRLALENTPWRIDAVGDRVLLLEDGSDLHVVDASLPLDMRSLGSVGFGGNANDLPHDLTATSSGFAYLARHDRVEVVDARASGAVRLVRSMGGFEALRAVRVTDDNGHLLVLDEHWVRSMRIDGVLSIFRLDDPANPVLVGRLEIPGLVDGWSEGLKRDFGPILVDVDGSTLLLAAHQIVAVDVSRPEAPRVALRQTLRHRAHGLAAYDGTVYVAEEGGGLAIFRITSDGSDRPSPVRGPLIGDFES